MSIFKKKDNKEESKPKSIFEAVSSSIDKAVDKNAKKFGYKSIPDAPRNLFEAFSRATEPKESFMDRFKPKEKTPFVNKITEDAEKRKNKIITPERAATMKFFPESFAEESYNTFIAPGARFIRGAQANVFDLNQSIGSRLFGKEKVENPFRTVDKVNEKLLDAPAGTKLGFVRSGKEFNPFADPNVEPETALGKATYGTIGVVGGLLDFLPGGKSAKQALTTIAKSKKSVEIIDDLVNLFKVAKEDAPDLAKRLETVTDEAKVLEEIKPFIKDEGVRKSLGIVDETPVDVTPSVQQAKQSGQSFDEWVKGQGNKVFHGGEQVDEIDFNKSGFMKTFFTSDSKEYASSYSNRYKDKGVINEIYISPSAKILDIKNAPKDVIDKIRELGNGLDTGKKVKITKPDGSILEVPERTGVSGGYGNLSFNETLDGAIRGKSHYAEDPNLVQIYKKLGYDGMVSYEDVGMGGKNIGLWNKDVVKTRSQLKAEWDKVAGATPTPTTPSSIPPRTNERGLITSIKQSDEYVPEVRSRVAGEYEMFTDADALAQASKIVDDNVDEAFRLVRQEGPATKLSNTVAKTLIDKFQVELAALKGVDDIAYNKKLNDIIELAEITAKKATNPAQALQSLSLWSKATPEGFLLRAQKVVNQVNESLPKGTEKIKLSNKLADEIVSSAQEIAKLPEGSRDAIVKTAETIAKIDSLIPVSLARKISIIQTMGQLLNPKTAIRNVVGNLGFAVAENISGAFGALVDTLTSAVTGKRTKLLPSLSAQGKGLVKGFKQGVEEALKGIETLGVSTQFDIPRTATFIGKDGKLNKVGAAFEKTLGVILKGPDRAFYTAAYDNSLLEQMKIAGVNTPTEAMKELAHAEGLYKTFQDENATTQAFQMLKRSLNVLSSVVTKTTDFGLGDIVLKYPKTPANLLNRGLAYSPFGFFKVLMELGKPVMGKGFDQKAFVDAFSRAGVGSATMYGIGATLADLGIITTTRETDKDVATLQKEVGLGEYRINTSALKRFIMGGFDPELAKLEEGDKIVSYDWFQPMALPIVMGADFSKNEGGASSILTQVMTAVTAGTDALAEQPLISGLTDLFKYGSLSDAGVKALQKLPSSFVPTFLNQIRQMTDNTARNPYDSNPLKYSLNLATQRIPFLSETLPAKVSPFGEEVETYQDGSNNLFNVFLNPAFVTKYKPTPEAKLVIDLYNLTGETSQFPRVQSVSQTINGENKTLTPKEVTEMQRLTGTWTKQIFTRMAESEQFRNLPPDKQVAEMKSIMTAIGTAGRVIILKDRPKRLSDESKALINAWVKQKQSEKSRTGELNQ